MTPARGRPRDFDTDAALDAAIQVFWKKGFEGVGVAELCNSMGIAKQSMYHWVGDKKGLYVAALRRYQMTCLSGLHQMLTSNDSPLASIRICLHAIADYAKSPDCMGCLLTNGENEFGTSDPAVSSAVDDAEAYIVREFRSALERAQQAGEISDSIDCQALGSAMAVLRNGVMIAGRAGQSAESIDQTINLIEAMLKTG